MSNEPRYPDLNEKSLGEQVAELKDYIVNLHRYIRYADNNIAERNLTRTLEDKINSYVDADGVIHILDELGFDSEVGFYNYVTFHNLQTEGETIINGDNITTGTILADYIDVDGIIAAKSIVVTDNLKDGSTIISGSNILTGTIDADYIRAGKILSTTNPNNFWDLDTGEFRLSPGNITVNQNNDTLSDYMDDTANDAVSAFENGTFATFVTNTNNSLDTKTTVYYESSSASITDPEEGDLWIDTDDNSLYRYNGATWDSVQDTDIAQALSDAADAQSTADSKIVTYAQASAPTDIPIGTLDVGDLWIDTDDSNKLYRWSGSAWVQYSDSSAANALDTSLDQAEVFKRLTNNGALQGIYMDNGNLYINGSYIKAGTIDTDYLDVGDIISTGSIIVAGADISNLNNNSGFITSGDIPDDLSDFNDDLGIVIETLPLYYRSTTQSTPSINSSTAIGTSATTDNAWEYVMPRPKRGCYFYTCERYTKSNGTYAFSTVREIANASYTSLWCSSSDATYLDGGKIYANSVTASQLNSTDINASGILTVGALSGATQAAIVSAVSTKTQYYLSTSDSSATGGSWADTVPTWTSGTYIWTKVKTTKTYADGTSDSTDSTAVYDEALTTALSTADSASSTATSASTTANSAVYRTQVIYKSLASNSAPAANTTWVTDATGNQNTWTTKRPEYSSSYKYLFVATQSQTMAQSAGTTCSCTTPTRDLTTTVIDGGNITTGHVTADYLDLKNLTIKDSQNNNTLTIDSNGNFWTSGTVENSYVDTVNNIDTKISIKDGKLAWNFRESNTYKKAVEFSGFDWTNNGGVSSFSIDFYNYTDYSGGHPIDWDEIGGIYSQGGTSSPPLMALYSTGDLLLQGGNDPSNKVNIVSDDLRINNQSLEDFVVDEGTSNAWYYRIWNSGRMECWRRFSKTATAINTASGSLYTTSGNTTFDSYPFNFSAAPVVNMSLESAQGLMLAVTGTGSVSTPPNIKVMRTAAYNSSTTFYVDVHASGMKASS